MDEFTFNATVLDDRTYVETVYTSLRGSHLARFSAILSMVSSAVIIILIMRSSVALSITYHRIMMGMSVCDLLASIAMALTTLPLPKDMVYTQFKGRYIGTFGTCIAQSVVQNIFSIATLAYNVGLSMYYYRAISGLKNRGSMGRSFEVFIHFFCFAVPTAFVVPISFLGTMNPTPYLPWCGAIVSYPYWCEGNTNGECYLRGFVKTPGLKQWGTTFLIAFLLLSVLVLMAMIVYSVFQHEKLLKMYSRIYRRNDGENIRQIKAKTNCNLSKIILVQALAYVVALLISQSGIFLRTVGLSALHKSKALQLYHIVTRPLQGFFNLIVFLADKIYHYRLANEEVTFLKAAGSVLFRPMDKAFVFEQMSMLENAEDGEVINEEEKSTENAFDGYNDKFPITLSHSDYSGVPVVGNPSLYAGNSRLSLPSEKASDPSFVISDCAISDNNESQLQNGKVKKEFYQTIRDQYRTNNIG